MFFKFLLWVFFCFLILAIPAYSNTYFDSLYVEAESGNVEDPMQIWEDTAASNGHYVMVQPGNESVEEPPVTGKVTIEVMLSPGIFNIWGRVKTPSGSEDSFWVQVDDGPVYKWNQIGENNTWKWVEFHDNDNNNQPISWNLEEGLHKITVYYREQGAKLDELYVSKYGDRPTKGDIKVKKIIHVSEQFGNDNNIGSENQPVKTLYRAYQIAHATKNEVTDYRILLRGGETYRDFQPVYGLDEGRGPINFGFVWDINRRLTISTYGPKEKARLLGGKHKHEGGPTRGLLVISPSTQNVLIENLLFEFWQEGAIMVYETEDVTMRNIKINKVGTYFFPGEQTPKGSEEYPYSDGVVYPKNSTRIIMDGFEITNCHNEFDHVAGLHAFYGTRLSHSEIRNSYIKNVSGSPFKFRREQANNVHVHHNEAYYTGHTLFEDSWVQPGFLRYSGDPGGNCPFSITFEKNIFHYPFCWSEYGEDCATSEAILCSVSNTTSCGEEACTDPERVLWIDNDIIYTWEEGSTNQQPEAPFNLKVESRTENSITFSWLDINVNEDKFIIERAMDSDIFEEIAVLGPNTTGFTDIGLASGTTYQYRLSVENSLGKSSYSEIMPVTTIGPNQSPFAIITSTGLTGFSPFIVNFSAEESSDPEQDELYFSWWMEDSLLGEESELSYTFYTSGKYTITLIVEDHKNNISTDSVEVSVYTITSIDSPLKSVSIYPNPVADERFFVANQGKSISISIFDSKGRLVELANQPSESIQSYRLSAGIYIVVLKHETGEVLTQPLVVH